MSKPEVVLIDLSGILHPAWRVAENEPVGVIFEATIGGVHRCAAASPGALVAVCLDSRKNWRKDLSPEYKSSRDKMPNAFYDCARRIEERLKADGFLLWRCETFEADDVIATATLKAVEAGHDVLVCSTDKDLTALLRTGPPQVRQMKLSTFDIVTAESFTAKVGLRPDQVGDWLALTGDDSDDVKGVEGIGQKHAVEALKQWGNLTALGAVLEADPGACGRNQPKKKGEVGEPVKWATGILPAWPQIELARKLVELRYDAPLNFEEIYQERVQQKLVIVEEDPMESDEIPISKGPGTVAKATEIFHAEAVTTELPQAPSMPTVATNIKPQRDLVPLAHVEYEHALEPRDPPDAIKFAAMMFNSRLFQQFGNESAILAAILRGRSLGIPVVTALSCFSIIQGRMAVSAQLLIALAQKDTDCEFLMCTESTSEKATYLTKNRRNPTTSSLTYTIQDATLAGLVKPNTPWVTRPADMLAKTAGSKLARREYPGATLGLYSEEEM